MSDRIDAELVGRAILTEIANAKTWATIEAGRDALLTMRRKFNGIRREQHKADAVEGQTHEGKPSNELP
jgi:hypothetical protein